MDLNPKQVKDLAAVTWGASNGSKRPILCGVMLEWEVKELGVELTAVTTDSYLLAIRRILIRNAEDSKWTGPDGAVLVNAIEFRRGLTQIEKGSAEVSIEPDVDGVMVKSSDYKVEISTWVKAIEGHFPRWRALIQEFSQEVPDTTFSVDLIKRAMKTANGVRYLTLMAPEDGKGPRLWKGQESSPNPLDGLGWWCLQMPAGG